MKNLGKFAIVLVFAVSVGMILTSCAPAAETPTQSAEATPIALAQTSEPSTPTPEEAVQTPRRGGTLIIGKEGEHVGLDPHTSITFASRELQELVYEGLVRADENFQLVGELAESWETEDAQTFVFHLRENSLFHNGRPFVCEDVQYSYTRIVDVGSPRAGRVADVDHIECPDEHTAVIVLKKPNMGFVGDLACGIGGPQPLIVPREVVEEHGDLGEVMVGTGPFVLSEHVPDNYTIFTRFEDYWDPDLPYLDAVRLEIIPEESSRLAALRTGRIHLTELREMANIEVAKELENVNVLEQRGISFYTINFNLEREPFTDERVRQAISLAIDTQEVIDLAVGGQAEPMGILPSALANWYVTPTDLPYYTYDPGRAIELLAEAGHPDGLDAGSIVTSQQYPLMVKNAEIIQEQLSRVGVEVDILVLEWADWISTWRASDFGMITVFTQVACDPVGMKVDYHTDGAKNVMNINDAQVDDLLEESDLTTDFAARQELVRQAQIRIAEVAPRVNLYSPMIDTGIRTDVQGFIQMPSEWRTFLRWTWLAEE